MLNLLLHPRNLIYQISCSPGDDWLATASAVTVPVLVAWGHHLSLARRRLTDQS